MGQDSQVKHFDHVGGSHAPLDAESQVLTGELIDNVTDLEHAPLPKLPHGHPFSARPQAAGTTQNNLLKTNGPKNPDPSTCFAIWNRIIRQCGLKWSKVV